jgi:hypothetical protein
MSKRGFRAGLPGVRIVKWAYPEYWSSSGRNELENQPYIERIKAFIAASGHLFFWAYNKGLPYQFLLWTQYPSG